MGYRTETIDALLRWKRGHKVFFLVLQGLIVRLRRFQSTISGGQLEQADQHLQSAARLMAGAASIMRFTGDFPQKKYESEVRPTMCPPNTIDGFSGLLSRDHAELLLIIRELKPVFANLPPQLAHTRRMFFDALAAVYDCHIHVCDQFGGGKTGSLRMNESTEKSSVEVLETLKENRLKPVTTSASGDYPFWKEPVSRPS